MLFVLFAKSKAALCENIGFPQLESIKHLLSLELSLILFLLSPIWLSLF